MSASLCCVDLNVSVTGPLRHRGLVEVNARSSGIVKAEGIKTQFIDRHECAHLPHGSNRSW